MPRLSTSLRPMMGLLISVTTFQPVVAKDSAFVVDRLLSAKLPPPVRAECGAGRYDLPPCPRRCANIGVDEISLAGDSSAGRSRAELSDSLRRRAQTFRYLCEKRHYGLHSDLEGKVVLMFWIAPQGTVDSVQMLAFPESEGIRREEFLSRARLLRFAPSLATTRLTWTFDLRTEKMR